MRRKPQSIPSARTFASIRSTAAEWLSWASRAASSPRIRATSVNRSSMALARWAVVYRVSPAAGPTRVVDHDHLRPALASKYAVVSPAIPGPEDADVGRYVGGERREWTLWSGSIQAGSVE